MLQSESSGNLYLEDSKDIEIVEVNNFNSQISRHLDLKSLRMSINSETTYEVSLEEAIIDLYQSIKIRKDSEEPDEDTIYEEKQHLKEIDPFVILEYIRNSFEIIVNMKMEENKIIQKETPDDAIKKCNDQSSRSTLITHSDGEIDNNDYE